MTQPPGTTSPNHDPKTVRDFGREWATFDQSELPAAEAREHFERYFRIFPWDALPKDAVGFDLGCGSGRWARFVADRVGTLYCLDASAEAAGVARRNLRSHPNCHVVQASAGAIPLPDASMDFGYTLGVLHHIPDPAAGLRECVRALRPGGTLLVYLYYALDDRPAWFRLLWMITDLGRRAISRLPHLAKLQLTTLIAALAYWPLARLAAVLERGGFAVRSIPLSYYRHASFYTMRTDALDRFGTRLEHRFSRAAVLRLLSDSGLEQVTLSESEPFWCAVGIRRV